MATTNTIGTSSRDYSTIQAWENAVPATPTGGYEGHCYNDSEFTAGVLISGHTTSAANYIKLTAATGQSFADHASKASNALFYDQTKGVGVAANDFAQSVVEIDNDYTTIDRLQLKRTGASYSAGVVNCTTVLPNSKIRECIIAKAFSGTAIAVNLRDSSAINCLIYDSGATAGTGISVFEHGNIINCTVVRVGTAGGTGVSKTYNDVYMLNTATFNWTTAYSSTANWRTGTGYNGTGVATAPGSNNQTSLTFANEFENTSSDFRIKSGATMKDTGNTDATNAPLDIIGQTRGATTLGDIGAWEFTSGVTITSGAGSFVGTATLTGSGRTIPYVAVSVIATASATFAYTASWKVPTTAANGTAVHVVVFSGTSPTYTILAQGTATVSGGYASISGSGSPGTKAFAFVHNYDDNSSTTSIFGGPGIATAA